MEKYNKNRKERIGHIIRPEELLKLVIEGNVKGRNHKRRPRLQYIQQDRGSGFICANKNKNGQ